DYPTPKVIGYVNLRGGIEEVHTGVVGIVETEHDVSKGDDEMVSCEFVTIDQMDNNLTDPDCEIERWTRASWPFIKNYLNAST
ncbi:MAG: hypothetical protein HKM24_00170, partial [Gammaproteobacteria bacterium]|nr:hypothetical protein [Gammaproteobacteria bacterium]